MIVFQLSSNFDPVKEMLKKRYHIFILMKKVSILRKPFQFDNVFEKTCDNECHEKQTKHIRASAADLLHIRIGNLDWCKCGHCKNEAREIDCICCREVNAMLIASAKIPERKQSISLSRFSWQLFDY